GGGVGEGGGERMEWAAWPGPDREDGPGGGGGGARCWGEMGAVGERAGGKALGRAPAGGAEHGPAPRPRLGKRLQALLAVSLRLVASRRRASSRMISTAICGNSMIRRKKRSLAITIASSLDAALTVAVPGTSQRIAISPPMSLRFSFATVSGPFGVSTITSASPPMMT